MSVGYPTQGTVLSATAAQWNATTIPILKDQLVTESDTGKFKIGDGVSLYSALPYSINTQATTLTPGISRLATHAEVITGTNDTIAVTPAGLASVLASNNGSSLQIENNGIPSSSVANTINFTGLLSVAETGNTSNVHANGPEFIYGSNFYSDTETINLMGNLSITSGTPPFVAQTGTLFYQGTTENLVMPSQPKVGNYLVLFIVNNGQNSPFAQTNLLPGWTQIGSSEVIVNGSYTNAYIIQVQPGFVNSIPIYMTSQSFFSCSAVCYEITNTTGYSLAAGLASGVNTGNGIANTLVDNNSNVPVLAFGAFTTTGNYYNQTPNFYNPLPAGTVMGINVPTSGFNGEYSNFGQVVLYSGQPTNVTFQISSNGELNYFYGVIFYGVTSPNIINLIAGSTLSIDGNLINPASIQTGGMLGFSGPDILNAYLTVEQNGTVLSTTVTTNNYTGGGVAISENGNINNVNIPGISFSGTSITGIAAGSNITGAVNAGTLTINSTAIGSGGTGGNGALVVESQENIIVASATALDFGPNFNVTQNGNTAKITTNAPLAFNGSYGSNLAGSKVIGTTYTNNTNSTFFLSVNAYNTTQGNNFNLTVNGIVVASFSEFTATYGNSLYALVNPGDTYAATTNGGNWSLASWFERPISNGIAQGGAVELVSIQNISGAAEVDFTGLAAGYEYFITGDNVACSVSTNTFLYLQFGLSGTWDTGSNYNWSGRRYTTDASASNDTSIRITGDTYNWSSSSTIRVDIHGDPSYAEARGVGVCYGNDFFNITGNYNSGKAISQVRLVFTTGTISGNFYLYRRSLRNVSSTQNITISPTYSDYTDFTSSRALNTVYTNSNTVAITVLIVYGGPNGSNPQFIVNGLGLGGSAIENSGAGNLAFAIVNPGETYQFSTNNASGTFSLFLWREKKDPSYAVSGGTINLPAGTTFNSGGLTSLEVDSNGYPIITTATKLNFGSGFAVTANGNQATIVNTGTISNPFGTMATFAVTPTYTDFTNVTGSRAIGTVYTNSTNLAIDVSVFGDTTSQYSKLALLVNGVNVSEIDTPVASGGDYGSIYARVNPGDTYEAVIEYGSYSLLQWLEKPDTTYTVLGAPIQGGATAVAYNGSQTVVVGNTTTTITAVPNCSLSLQGGSVAQNYLISFDVTHDGAHSNHFYVVLDGNTTNTIVFKDSSPASGIIFANNGTGSFVNIGNLIGQRWTVAGTSIPVTIPGDGAVHTVAIYSAVADETTGAINLYERYISAVPVGITNGQQVNGTPTNNFVINNNGTSATASVTLNPTITTRYILLSNSNSGGSRSTYTLSTTAGTIEEANFNWVVVETQSDGSCFGTLLLQAGQSATVTATTTQSTSAYINCSLLAIPLPASNYVYSSGNLITIEQAGTSIGTSGTINTGDDLTATISSGVATIGHTTIYPNFMKGGTLIATLNINTASNFGPFTTSKFDTTNTFTPVAGHIYKIEFVFSSYNPNTSGAGNFLIRFGTNGYFVADAENNTTANSNLSVYYTSGSSFTPMSQTGSYYKSIPIPQKAQLILCCTSTGNMIWGNFLSGSTPLAGPDTHTTLLGNAVQVGYAGNTGDTFTAFVYDMGLTP